MTLKVRTCQHGLSLHLKVIKWRMANIKKLSYHRLLEILTQLMDGLRNLALATFEVADLTFSRERLEIPCLLLFGSFTVVVSGWRNYQHDFWMQQQCKS